MYVVVFVVGECGAGFMRINDFTPCGKSSSSSSSAAAAAAAPAG